MPDFLLLLRRSRTVCAFRRSSRMSVPSGSCGCCRITLCRSELARETRSWSRESQVRVTTAIVKTTESTIELTMFSALVISNGHVYRRVWAGAAAQGAPHPRRARIRIVRRPSGSSSIQSARWGAHCVGDSRDGVRRAQHFSNELGFAHEGDTKSLSRRAERGGFVIALAVLRGALLANSSMQSPLRRDLTPVSPLYCSLCVRLRSLEVSHVGTDHRPSMRRVLRCLQTASIPSRASLSRSPPTSRPLCPWIAQPSHSCTTLGNRGRQCRCLPLALDVAGGTEA